MNHVNWWLMFPFQECGEKHSMKKTSMLSLALTSTWPARHGRKTCWCRCNGPRSLTSWTWLPFIIPSMACTVPVTVPVSHWWLSQKLPEMCQNGPCTYGMCPLHSPGSMSVALLCFRRVFRQKSTTFSFRQMVSITGEGKESHAFHWALIHSTGMDYGLWAYHVLNTVLRKHRSWAERGMAWKGRQELTKQSHK